jgi:histidinol-phosphate phosphatase family protein
MENIIIKPKKPILFLDRDGVINVRPYGAYVLSWAAFEFCEGALAALAKIAPHFERIIVVTNQMGVYKQLMTAADLAEIHENMQQKIELAGGRIDKIYAATGARDDINRKPNTAMAEQAAADLGFSLSASELIMVGDAASDLAFGQQLGAKLVLIETAVEDVAQIKADYPAATPLSNLAAFAQYWLSDCI